MKRILITNQFLRSYSGSELATYDLAREFLARGYTVTIGTFEYEAPLKGLFEVLGVDVIDLGTNAKAYEFDLIWAHHFTTLDACILSGLISAGQIVFSSLSPYNPLECPPLYLSKLSRILANSPETAQALLDAGLDASEVLVFPNPVYRTFFAQPARLSERLKRVAVVSNHVPKELEMAASLLRAEGVEVDLFGEKHRARLITPELLGDYDAVVSIGRTVQYALAMGMPVYCYDRFGGPGYITPQNADAAAAHNFSGRCVQAKKPARRIADELLQQYGDVAAMQKLLKQLGTERYDLAVCVDEVLASLLTGCTPADTQTLINLLRRQNAYRDDLYGQFRRSLCWKLTAPLRKLKKALA